MSLSRTNTNCSFLILSSDKSSFSDPAIAHAALREIVERAMKEARKLPELNTSMDAIHFRKGCVIADHSYEDLLATAILNKVNRIYIKIFIYSLNLYDDYLFIYID